MTPSLSYLYTTPVFASSAAPCTPSLTIYNPTSNNFTVNIYLVTFNAGSTTPILGASVLSLSVGANSTASGTGTAITSNQFLVGFIPIGSTIGIYATAFSCQ